MEWWHLYLVFTVSNIAFVIGFISILIIVLLAVGFGFGVIPASIEDEWETYFKIAKMVFQKKFIFIWATMTFFVCLVPSQKEMAMIYVIPKIINNENISSLPGDMAKFARDAMTEKLKEWSDGNK